MRLQFIPIHVFRATPSVTFFDAGVPGTNGTDVAVHQGAATSPPDANGFEQYSLHQHQVDHNLVPEGQKRLPPFESCMGPVQFNHVIHLIHKMGALQIPVGTYHR